MNQVTPQARDQEILNLITSETQFASKFRISFILAILSASGAVIAAHYCIGFKDLIEYSTNHGWIAIGACPIVTMIAAAYFRFQQYACSSKINNLLDQVVDDLKKKNTA